MEQIFLGKRWISAESFRLQLICHQQSQGESLQKGIKPWKSFREHPYLFSEKGIYSTSCSLRGGSDTDTFV